VVVGVRGEDDDLRVGCAFGESSGRLDSVAVWQQPVRRCHSPAVADSLNSQRVPDLFVESSCACWNQPVKHPETFGFGTNYTPEGRLLGSYVKHHYPHRKVTSLWQDDACCHPTILDTFRLSADPTIVGGLIERFAGGKASPALAPTNPRPHSKT
jgi:hypothetical protein